MTGPDPYADWDAAYVLGALSAADRTDYEAHLAECPSCRDAVAALAGMPGLLAKVPYDEVLGLEPPEGGWPEPPASLMPELPAGESAPATARRTARRGWLVGVAAAAALVVGGAGGYAVAHLGDTAPPAGIVATGPVRLAFSDVVPSSMTAVVDVTATADGTQLDVECQYARATDAQEYPGEDPSTADYSIWVVDRGGASSELKQWTAKPDKVMHPSATTPLPPSQIAAIEIRRVDDGETVMRAAVPGVTRQPAADALKRLGSDTATA